MMTGAKTCEAIEKLNEAVKTYQDEVSDCDGFLISFIRYEGPTGLRTYSAGHVRNYDEACRVYVTLGQQIRQGFLSDECDGEGADDADGD